MQRRRSWKHWLIVVAGFTAVASTLAAWMGGGITAASLVASLTYTVCIGCFCSLAGYVLWPRLEGLPPGIAWAGRLGSMAAAVALGTLAALATLSGAGLTRVRDFWEGYWHSLRFASFIAVTVGGTLVVYEYWRSKYEHAELEKERALKLATEARLASLESRIHPHFLFNTLNSISSLIPIDPAGADAQLQRLAALLRFSLDASETPLVRLEQELKIVRDYLDIERTRFGGRLRFTVAVPEELLGCSVPPLAVQTLVENSVKHVIAPSREGGEVRVTAAAAGGVVTIAVADGGPGVSTLIPGHGLDNLRARLQVLYGDRARLEFGPEAVRLEVPL